MTHIIDASVPDQAKAHSLVAAGITTVIRHYSRDTITPSKRLTPAEAQALVGAGLRLGAVHEDRFGDRADNFDQPTGLADGVYARGYAGRTIRQPGGSVIWFGVDFDATKAQIHDLVLPYFHGVAQAMAAASDLPRYDEAAPGSDIGDFTLPAAPAPMAATLSTPMYVIARSGLNLRTGPGEGFEVKRLLACGTWLVMLKSTAGWAMVDLEGDGLADGFVSAAYLSATPVQVPPAPPPVAPHTVPAAAGADAAHIPELIRQGSTAPGMAAAHATAAAALAAKGLPPYPTNACGRICRRCCSRPGSPCG